MARNIKKGIEDEKKRAVDAAVDKPVNKMKQGTMLETKKLGEVIKLETNLYLFCLLFILSHFLPVFVRGGDITFTCREFTNSWVDTCSSRRGEGRAGCIR